MSTHFRYRSVPLFCCLLLLSFGGCSFIQPIITGCNTFRYRGASFPNICSAVTFDGPCPSSIRLTAGSSTGSFMADVVCDSCCIASVTIVESKASREELLKGYIFVTAQDVPQDDGSVITVEYFAGPGAVFE